MSAGSATCHCAHVKVEKLAQWQYVGIELIKQSKISRLDNT